MPWGTVKEVKGNTAVVVLERQDMCGDCHACEMISGKKACTLTCEKHIPCKVGDEVEVTLTTDYFLKATYLIYGVPLVGLIAGLVLGVVISQSLHLAFGDLLTAAFMLLGAAMGGLYIKKQDKKKAYQKFLPHIIGMRKQTGQNEI